MKTPTLEEVKEYFKDAETIQCLSDKDEYILDFSKEVDFLKNSIHLTLQKDVPFSGYETYSEIWNGKKGYAKILTYKKPAEETFTITKEQIKELADRSIQLNIIITEWFPKAFEPEKKELVVGNWYVDKYKRLFVPTKIIDSENCLGYGFGCVHNNFISENDDNVLWEINGSEREATQQEVEEALKAEAVRMGYRRGIGIIDLYPHHNNKEIISSDNFDWEIIPSIDEFGLRDSQGIVIFYQGKWATIIQPKKMTQAEIETQLGYNIEIVN